MKNNSLNSILIIVFVGFLVMAPKSVGATTWSPVTAELGRHAYLRQMEAYKEKGGNPFEFYANRDVWVFGEGEAMLIDWLKQGNGNFKIGFSILDKNDMDALMNAATQAEKDALLNLKITGPLFAVTTDEFEDQSGVYLPMFDPEAPRLWLVEILLNPSETPELNTLLQAKYGNDTAAKQVIYDLKNDLALDAQIYQSSGTFSGDTRLTIHFPGYTPGLPPLAGGNNTTKDGWNTIISMGKDPNLFMQTQGLSYDDLAAGNKRWTIIMGWNTHLDYDGKHTGSAGVQADESGHSNYLGSLTPVGGPKKGYAYRAMELINTYWSQVPFGGDRNLVSHSTGYYLAMDFLNYMPQLWPAPTVTRYFAISPNIRGSTMIGGIMGGAPADFVGQYYDSMDDMYRDNWHWLRGYRFNEATRGFYDYRTLNDVELYMMLAYGDAQTAGTGGFFSTVTGDNGVVCYSNYQPYYGNPLDPENLDDNEYGRRKRFVLYESLYNMKNDGGPLALSIDKASWEDGGDAYLRNMPQPNISVFDENVNIRKQKGGDDGMNYALDHSDLAQRVAVMRYIVNGSSVDVSPEGGNPISATHTEEQPGTILYSFLKSNDQQTTDTDPQTNTVGGQIYEITRKIQGNKVLVGWEDKWWQRADLRRSYGASFFDHVVRSFESIRNVELDASEEHGIWLFSSEIDNYLYVPTWLDKAFSGKDLWVRVQNGPLEGGLFKVRANQDYMGIGYTDKGVLSAPAAFPDKNEIKLFVIPNNDFLTKKPNASDPLVNYITLGGIKYLYNSSFYGPIPLVRNLVELTDYVDDDENENKGTGHFLSVDLNPSAVYLTDTIAPIVRFE